MVQVTCNSHVADRLKVLRRAREKKINLRVYARGAVSKPPLPPSPPLSLSFFISSTHMLTPSLPLSPVGCVSG